MIAELQVHWSAAVLLVAFSILVITAAACMAYEVFRKRF